MVEEPGSSDLAAFLAPEDRRTSSEILLTESVRAVRRRADLADEEKGVAARLADVLAGIDLRLLDRALLTAAARLEPVAIRTLNAIRLATALSMPSPPTFVGYDRRQLLAAERSGLLAASPGVA